MEPERGTLRSRDRRWLRVSGAAGLLDVRDGTVRGWADTGGLVDVQRAVARSTDPRAALDALAAAVCEELELRACLAFEWDEHLGGLVCLAGGEHPTLQLADQDEFLSAFVTGEPVRLDRDVLVPFGVGEEANGCLLLVGQAGRMDGAGLALARDAGDLAALAVHRLQARRHRDEQQARLGSLLHAGNSITSSLVLQEVLDTVAREVVDALGARYCVIWEYEADGDMLVERAGYSVDPGYSVDGDFIPLEERPHERDILFSEHPVIETLSDPELDQQSRESMERWGEKTCLSQPLRFGGSTMGVLVVCETERERRFMPEELALVRGLAAQASAAVHNARVYRDLAERHRELEVRARRDRLVSELGIELSSSLDPSTVLDSACRRICELLDASGGEIWARCDEQQVECLASWADGAFVDEWVGRRYPVGHWAATSLAMDSGETVAIVSLEDERLGAAEREVMKEWDQRSLLTVPMVARGRTVGTVEVTQAGRERAFTDEEVAIAETCARMTALAVDNAQLFERQAGDARRLTSLLEAGRALTSSLDIQDVLNTLVRTAAASLGCPEALIFEHDAEGDTLTMRSVYQDRPTVYQDLDKPHSLDDFPSDRAVLEATDVIIETIADPSLPADVRESMRQHGEKTCLTVPLRYAGMPLGMLTLVETEAERVFTDDELEFVRGFGEQAALAIHNAQLFEDMKGMHLGNLRALSSALTAKDFYTIGHTARVAAYAVLLAEELGWTPRAVQQLEEATYLHDIGKIAVADRVLLKSGPLTDEEWGLMKQHPVISAEIIETLLDDDFVAGVRHHHERYDGNGYPDGIAGEAIPLVARLLCLVDSYDAMSSRRVYRPALSREECQAELELCAGTQFDPDMVVAFRRVLERMAGQRAVLQAAADQAAASIAAGDHLALCRSQDVASVEYGRILRLLRQARLEHGQVQSMVTVAPVDELRCMMVVDDDDDDARAVLPGAVEFCDDLELDTLAGRRADANVVSVDRRGTWIVAAAPIRADDGTIVGAVAAARTPKDGVTTFGRGSTVSDTFSQIMHTAGARQTRVEIESMTDALTGLYNHRRFHELLHDTVDGARAADDEVALIFCDIDRFKQFNDRYGHLAGDDLLRRVSRILTACVRRGDVAARYGGDEFCVLLRDATVATAMDVAERVREQVAELWMGQDRAATISIGVAALAGHRDAEDLLEQADKAMYAAKQGGRDRVVRADTLESAKARLETQL
jgi:diguanylate cyclase (GGDEF)-like protein